MSNKDNDRYYKSSLVKQSPHSLSQVHTEALDVRPYQQVQPLVIYVQQAPTEDTEDTRSSTYKTGKERGKSSNHQLPQIQLPSLLTVSISLVVMTCFLVASSMFSIALTSYSNSVDRVDRSRTPNPFLVVE